MELSAVEDFDRIVDRYEECFRFQNHDRPVMRVTTPTGVRVETPPPPPTVHERWYNFEWRLECAELQLPCTHYEAEAFPIYGCNLGPDMFTAFLGSELETSESSPNTTWVKPRVKDWNDEPSLCIDPENHYWLEWQKFMRMAAERGKGKWITTTGDQHTNGDALSALRTPEELCIDLIERPDEIKKRLDECMAAWKQVVDRACEITMPHNDGVTSCWLGAAVRGRYVTLQNDFACMVSPDMFREFFQEMTRREAAYLDRSIYHWDGPGAIPDKEPLCEIEQLDMLQWTPGAGQKPMAEWVGLLKDVQDRGKGLWISCGDDEVQRIMKRLKPEGVIIQCGAASPEEARELVKNTERICRG